MKIIGLDPGSLSMGYAIIENTNNQITHVVHSSIKACAKLAVDERLKIIGDGLDKILNKYKPNVAVIEEPFLGLNTKGLISLAKTQGAIIYVLKGHCVSIIFKSARGVKKSVTGSGASTKEQVRMLALARLNLESKEGLDATDALAVALSIL